VLTVCAAFVLLVLGSLVTTLKAGMADKDWPTSPTHLFTRDVANEAQQQGYATSLYVLEHTHRLAGYFVGCCAIVLAVWMGWSGTRGLRWLGLVALLAVSVQGVLGGFRVKLNALFGTDLATLHGCLAQVVFAFLASLILFTSSWWTEGVAKGVDRRVRRLALLLVGLSFTQIVFGAIIRHSYLRLAQRLHFLLAFAVVVVAVWLFRVLREEGVSGRLTVLGRLLGVLLTLQVMVGVEAWMMRFGKSIPPDMVAPTLGLTIVRTLHFALGSLVFATTMVLAILAHARVARPVALAPVRREVLEGVA
jgi:heme A synthase